MVWVLNHCMLRLEPVAGVAGMTHAHSLWAQDVDLEEVAWHQLLKPVLVPSLMHFAQFHQNLFFISLGDSYSNTIDVPYSNYSSDNIQWQSYLEINITQFNALVVLIQNQIPLRYRGFLHPTGQPGFKHLHPFLFTPLSVPLWFSSVSHSFISSHASTTPCQIRQMFLLFPLFMSGKV